MTYGFFFFTAGRDPKYGENRVACIKRISSKADRKTNRSLAMFFSRRDATQRFATRRDAPVSLWSANRSVFPVYHAILSARFEGRFNRNPMSSSLSRSEVENGYISPSLDTRLTAADDGLSRFKSADPPERRAKILWHYVFGFVVLHAYAVYGAHLVLSGRVQIGTVLCSKSCQVRMIK